MITKDFDTKELIDTYLIYFVHKRNEANPNEDGLYSLQIVRKEEADADFGTKDTVGIYCPNSN